METIGKAIFPSICIAILLRQVAIVCHDMETEFSIWRGAFAVQSSNSFTEFCWLGQLFYKLVELAYVIMRVRNLDEGAVSHGSGSKFVLNVVNGQRRFVLAFQGFTAVMAKRDLTAYFSQFSNETKYDSPRHGPLDYYCRETCLPS